jgi:hypothetical protein
MLFILNYNGRSATATITNTRNTYGCVVLFKHIYQGGDDAGSGSTQWVS